MPKTKFKHFPNRPAKLTAEFAKAQYQKLVDRIPEAEAAKSPAKWLKLYADWNELGSYIYSEGSRLSYAYSCYMNSPMNEAADKLFREKISPSIQRPEHELVKAFLSSRHRLALVQKYGGQLVTVYKTALKPLDPVNTRLRVEESKLTTQYDKLKGTAKVKLRNKTMTLAKVASFIQSPDESLRKDAWLASRSWYFSNRKKMADTFTELVTLRTQMAKNLGYESYTELGYEERGRSDYDREDVKKFRKLVKKYAAPMNRELARDMASALGKKVLRPWDAYDPRTTLPLGVAPVKGQLAKAQAFFDQLSPRLGQHFGDLRRKGMIDLESRSGKQTNPFCTSFSDSGEVAILCSSVGNASDVSTLLHESGHAFQAMESGNIDTVELQWGTSELAEIPSTAMEYLSLPNIERFFSKENARKYSLECLQVFASSLCYVSVVDEFQHWIYDNPTATPARRDKKWEELCDAYLAASDYTGYQKYRSLRWYAQMHIFDIPFYYIDYALAEVCAMQIAMIDEHDHKKAMKIYMELCKLGGTKSFLAALKHVGLRSPFDEALIKELSEFVSSKLELSPTR